MTYNELEQKHKDYFLEEFYENLGIDSQFIEIDFDIKFDIVKNVKYSEDGEEFLYEYKQFNGVEIESYLVVLVSNLTDVMFIYDSDSFGNKEIITTAIEIASTKLFEKYPELLN
jgi:hypothetical protein